jgi:hypothetical protein
MAGICSAVALVAINDPPLGWAAADAVQTTNSPDAVYVPDTSGAPTPPVMPNGGFESGSLDSWSNDGTVAPLIQTDLAHGGNFAAKLDVSNLPVGFAAISRQISVPSPGDGLFLHFWAYCSDDGSGNISEQMNIGVTPELFFPDTQGEWVEYAVPLGAHAGTTITVQFGAFTSADATGDVGFLVVDDFSISYDPMAVVNGDFEMGNLYGWTSTGAALAYSPLDAGERTGHYFLYASIQATSGSSEAYQDVAIREPSLTLTFYRKSRTNDAAIGHFEALIQDTSDTTLATIFSDNANQTDYVAVTADLSAYEGQTIRLRFRAVVDTDTTGHIFSLSIDDVSLAGVPPTPDMRYPYAEGVATIPSIMTSDGLRPVGIVDSIQAKARWTDLQVTISDYEIPKPGIGGITQIDETLDTQQATMQIVPLGDLWTIPSQVPQGSNTNLDNVAQVGELLTVAPTQIARSWGNQEILAAVTLGPRNAPKNFRVFQGVMLQRQNKGEVLVTGQVTCADDSILYSDIAICYSLGEFGGKRRGQIVADICDMYGIPYGHIPLGNWVTKAVLLNNASILPFIRDFGSPENWDARFDEYGVLQVNVVDINDAAGNALPPNWILDEAMGDWDLDTFEEYLPQRPPGAIYITGQVPVYAPDQRPPKPGQKPTHHPVTTVTVEESDVFAQYNPRCAESWSGHVISNPDGSSYKGLYASDQRMLISKVIVTTTAVDGVVTLVNTKTWKMFAPYAPTAWAKSGYDSSGLPVGYGSPFMVSRYHIYQDAISGSPPDAKHYYYRDHSMRVAPFESLMLFSEVTETHTYSQGNTGIDQLLEVYPAGTLKSTDKIVWGWFIPTAPIVEFSSPFNDVPLFQYSVDDAYVYSEHSGEWYMQTQETTVTFNYDYSGYPPRPSDTGGLLSQVEEDSYWYAGPNGTNISVYGQYGSHTIQNSIKDGRLVSTNELKFVAGQLIYQKLTEYRSYGTDSHKIITTETDFQTGQTNLTTLTAPGGITTGQEIRNGPPPLAPTVGGTPTPLVQLQSETLTLLDPELDEWFVPSRKAITNVWAESEQELLNVALMEFRRQAAIRRRVAMPFNPLIRVGHLVRLIAEKRQIDANHVVVGKSARLNTETGDMSLILDLEFWLR